MLRRVLPIAVAGVLAAGVLAGCASSETGAIDPDTAQFQTGVATEQQVTAKLGPASATSLQPDGARVDIFSYAYAAPDPQNFIPIAGLFDGGAKVKMTIAWFSFDRAGVLLDYKKQVYAAQVRSGILNP
jgi:hypothetical protein